MEEKIRDILSVFTKIPADQIGPATPIGRQAVKSSILLHRMYARLAEEGFVVENYADINTFSELLARNGGNGNRMMPVMEQMTQQVIVSSPVHLSGGTISGAGIGIDIEEIASLPRTNDFRKETFYKMNFTPSEIAYCVLQPDPYASFAGIFSAKEAMVKADGSIRSKTFNTFDISHNEDGKPVCAGFQLSISHAGPVAVAVALSMDASGWNDQKTGPAGQVIPEKKKGSGGWVSWLALLISLLAIILIFTR